MILVGIWGFKLRSATYRSNVPAGLHSPTKSWKWSENHLFGIRKVVIILGSCRPRNHEDLFRFLSQDPGTPHFILGLPVEVG